MPIVRKVTLLDKMRKVFRDELPSGSIPLEKFGGNFPKKLDNEITKAAEKKIRKLELDNREFENRNRTKQRSDRFGNLIGDGTWHAPYSVYDIPGADVSISPSLSSESVYVTYRMPNGKSSQVRYSTHFSNNDKDITDALEELGIIGSVPVWQKKLGGRNVKKKDIELYPSSGKTYDELVSLPEEERQKYKDMLIVDENGSKKNWMFGGSTYNDTVGRDYFIKKEFAPLFEDY
jgi:hypothetical protein